MAGSPPRKVNTDPGWFAHEEVSDNAPSPAHDHQFGNPDTKHNKPGSEVKAEAFIRPYMAGYGGHTPAQQDRIGGGSWKPVAPYGLNDSPKLVDKDGKLVKQNFTQGTDWDPDGDGQP